MSEPEKDAHCSSPFAFDMCVRAVFRIRLERLPCWFPHVMITLLSVAGTWLLSR